jgi:hypothetical protein
MGMIKIYGVKSKPAKKKPGWQKAEAEHAAWLANLQKQTLFDPNSRPKTKWTSKKPDVVVTGPVIDQSRVVHIGKAIITPGAGTTKPVARPEIMYKDNPEMLARELAARSVKHNTAPAYNKGGDVFVTQEHLMTQLAGNKRRS